MLYKLIRYFLFKTDAEKAHHLALSAMKKVHQFGLSRLLYPTKVNDTFELMGLKFENRVGLAAGLDKNAEYIDALASVGFGFIEVGTITPKSQPGNEKPRLFRIVPAQGIINRMGFNNDGVDNLISHVKRSHYKGVLGINIGKNFSTPVENAVDDYLLCFQQVYEFADYITVNISSPNTPGLRKLQHGEALIELLTSLKQEQNKLQKKFNKYVPLAVKIAPDLTDEEIDELATAFIKTGIDAVIATNTTFSRQGVEQFENAGEQGGLSGAPVFDASTAVVEKFAKLLDQKIPIIAVGGITKPEDAVEKIKAGASLVQIYSGFIYQGPELISQSAQAIAEMK